MRLERLRDRRLLAYGVMLCEALDASHAQDKQETATMELRKAGVTWGTAGFMGTLLVALLVKATGLMAY